MRKLFVLRSPEPWAVTEAPGKVPIWLRTSHTPPHLAPAFGCKVKECVPEASPPAQEKTRKYTSKTPLSMVKSDTSKVPPPKSYTKNVLLRFLIEAIRDGGGGGLVSDAQHFKPCNGPRLLRRLALLVVEIGWDCHHRMLHLLAQVVLRRHLHLC